MQKEIEDKTSAEYQRQTWEAGLTDLFSTILLRRFIIFFRCHFLGLLKLAKKILKLSETIPPFLSRMETTSWSHSVPQALRKSINGLVNKVNAPWLH